MFNIRGNQEMSEGIIYWFKDLMSGIRYGTPFCSFGHLLSSLTLLSRHFIAFLQICV